jgi:hypothetical protein
MCENHQDKFKLGTTVNTEDVFPGATEMFGETLKVVQVAYSFLTEDELLMQVKFNAKDFNPDDYEE